MALSSDTRGGLELLESLRFRNCSPAALLQLSILAEFAGSRFR
jgi:hypothetical protein